MSTEPQAFQSTLVSIYQSAVDAFVRARSNTTALATRPGLDNDLVRAASQVGGLRAAGQPIPTIAPSAMAQTVWDSARLGLQLLEARAKGHTDAADQIDGELRDSPADPHWAETIVDYLQYFGPDGRRATVPYIRAAQVEDKVLPLKPGATVALVGDWGTGTDTAVDIMRRIALWKPDVLIHIGDVYYSGTAEEYDLNFTKIIDATFDRATTPMPVYTLTGNHDMYSGGGGYYGILQTLNPVSTRQPASFFCLRSADQKWQFVAMDTGLHDDDPFTVTNVVTYLERDEEDWLVARIQEFTGKTILLSHHQLFSAFSRIGPANADGSFNPVNPLLAKSFARFQAAANGRLAAWFWGHEHNLCIFESFAGLAKGRCIGHGAVPVFPSQTPYTSPRGIAHPPALLNDVRLAQVGAVYAHGYTILRLNADGSATADYYVNGNNDLPIWSETL